MVSKRFDMPKFLSDLAGNDPAEHGDDPQAVIAIIRNHLHRDPHGKRLPGAEAMLALFKEFEADLPSLAEKARLTAEESDPYRGYLNYMDLLREFRDQMLGIAAHVK